MSRKGENIYKRKDGRWEARYIKFHDENGKAKYGYIYDHSYKNVRRKLFNAISSAQKRDDSVRKESERDKYEYWLDIWMNMSKTRVKESTFIRYKNSIENHIKPSLGQYPIEKITTAVLEKFISDKLKSGRMDHKAGLSPKTVSDIMIIVKDSLKYSQYQGGYIICNQDRLSIKRQVKQMRVLNREEEKKLMSFLLTDLDRTKLGVFICLYTGIRIGELCALKWENVCLEEKVIKIEHTMQRLQKMETVNTQKTRIIVTEPKSFAALRGIPIPDFLAEQMVPFQSKSYCFLLTGKKNEYIEPRTMQNHFKMYLRKIQIQDANFHSLRHTFATRCIEAGFDVKTLSEILGHSSVKITLDKYVHTSMDLKRRNMEKLQLLK